MTLPIYTIDFETDPFLHGRKPEVFAGGLFDGESYVDFWGSDAVKDLMGYLEQLPGGYVYAHNGGRFDFFFIMPWILGSDMRIINSRIISAKMQCIYGEHELRDSFAIMPYALSKMKSGKGDNKKEIDINKLEKSVRNKHKAEIREYLKYDCIALWHRVKKFQDTFGEKVLTAGTASMTELKKVHSFDCLEKEDDEDIRHKYYYGGRVECFESGIIEGKFKVFDVNSMYPYVMKNMLHPIGKPVSNGNKLRDDTMFLTVTGHNRGAFPSMEKGRLLFDIPYGTFNVTRHEFDVAMEYDLFDLERIERCVNYGDRVGNFKDFVDKFYELRLVARLDEDEILALFYKGILVNAYGKFGQNPDNYKEYTITNSSDDISRGMKADGWRADSIECYGKYTVWSKPTVDTNRYNVSTGASITGAARSVLLRGIATARRPIYCDTDSIICEDLPLAKKDGSELGAWKTEASFNVAAIAGRKLYAMFETRKSIIAKLRKESEDKKKFDKKILEDGSICVKQANKGVAVTSVDIWNVCCGEVIETYRDAPSFKLDGSYNFISRRVRMTA